MWLMCGEEVRVRRWLGTLLLRLEPGAQADRRGALPGTYARWDWV